MNHMSSNFITVLGINEGHDSGAALVKDGKIIAAINEERMKNIKHFGGIPIESIREVFNISKIDPSEVDVIAIAGLTRVTDPSLKKIPFYLKIYYESGSIAANPKISKFLVSVLHKYRKIDELKEILIKIGIKEKELVFIEHHLAHAASAYHLSPWNFNDEILILTSDGSGDGISSTVSIGRKGRIERIEESSYYHSLGNVLYSPITQYLGMKWADHEYKVMGLAPYGKAEYCIDKIKKLIDINETNPLQFKNQIGAYTTNIYKKLTRLLEGQRFDNIAAATQMWYEKLITSWVKNALKKTGLKKIACAGGNFLNVKANKLILEMDEIEDAFFCPASGDDGIAVGAALEAYYEITIRDGKKPTKYSLQRNYFGTFYSNEYIKEILKKQGLLEKSQFIDNIEQEIGELVAKDGNVVARCKGGMEWGPRALGNRSIIANPSDPKIIRKINHAIKMRDFWMPFGPSILTSRIDDYLIHGRIAPYMILAFDTISKNRNDLEAALHPFDFSCRPQTVDNSYNPDYEKVLKSFESKTGIGGVLNTSFNIHGYPIVHSPEIAISTFKNSALDYLALGNYLIKK